MARHAWLTPDDDPSAPIVCREIAVPAYLLPALDGALWQLTEIWRWEKFGTLEPAQVIELYRQMYHDYRDSEGCMVGAINAFMTEDTPAGWLLCDGSTYGRVDYPRLYASIHSSFILDADNFNVPDLTDRFLGGVSSSGGTAVPGVVAGENSVTLSIDEMPAHTHTYTPPIINIDIEAPGVPDPIAAGLGVPTQTGSTGDGNAHENRPEYMTVRWYIRYR